MSTAGIAGSEIRLWEKKTVVGPSGGTRVSWVVESPVPATITQATAGRVQRVFGEHSTATYIGAVDRDVRVEEGEIAEVLVGAFAGLFLVVRKVHLEPVAGVKVLGLEAASDAPKET